MAKEFALEEGLKAEIHFDLIKTTLKYIESENTGPWWNTRILVQEIQYHSWKKGT